MRPRSHRPWANYSGSPSSMKKKAATSPSPSPSTGRSRKSAGLTSLLLLQWDCDDHPPDHVIQLEVPLRTVRVGVVAPDAGLRDGPVRIDRLQERIRPVHDHFAIPTIGMLQGL